MAGEIEEKAPVPYARFQSVNDKLAAASLRLEELEPVAAKVATLEQAIAKQAADLAAANERAEIYGTGITDPEAITVARALHAGLPADTRPALPAWLGQIKSAPATAPKALQPYFAQPAAVEAAPVAQPAVVAAVAAPKPPAPPIAQGGAQVAPPPGGKIGAADLRQTRGTPEGAGVMAAWRAQKGLPPKPAKS
jgi:hypothetical protein